MKFTHFQTSKYHIFRCNWSVFCSLLIIREFFHWISCRIPKTGLIACIPFGVVSLWFKMIPYPICLIVMRCRLTHGGSVKEEIEHPILYSTPVLRTLVHSLSLSINAPTDQHLNASKCGLWLNPNERTFKIFAENIMQLMFVESKSANVLAR